MHETFLANIASLENTQAGLVEIYGYVMDLGVDGKLQEIDQLFLEVDTKTTRIDYLLSFLMSTCCINPYLLKNRDAFYNKTWHRFVAEVGEEETKDCLLGQR